MLKFVFGRAGSGKTQYVRNLLCESAKSGKKGLCLIVPDQFSFESERSILQTLGASDASKVEVLGFSRLCDVVFKLYGGRNLPEIDNGTKAVMMRLAFDDCADLLNLYRKSTDNEAFVNAMLKTVEEFKFARISPEQISEFSFNTDDALLANKLREISAIYSSYETQINKDFFDPSDKLELLYKKIENNDYFKDKTVVFDSFFFFSQQQLRIVELAISQAKEVIITFCADGFDDKTPMLSEIVKTAKHLLIFANKCNISVLEPVFLSKALRFNSDELKAVEACLFRNSIHTYSDSNGDVVLCECKTRYDEADYIARTILNLVREKDYRFRDFAVIARDDEICKNAVDIVFEKYNIPFFADRRIPLKYQPLVRLVVYLLKIASSLTTERVMSYLKTSLGGVSQEDILLLENYVYIWKISPEMWVEDFDMNPEGFVENFDQKSRELLEQINTIRSKAVEPLVRFKKEISFAQNGKDISKAIYKFLKDNEIDKRLSSLADNIVTEETYSKVWDEVIRLLDSLSAVTEKRAVDVKKYLSLFNLNVSVKTIGSIPQHIDEVSIGNAERMRPAAPKVVFIVGANEKVFPKVSSSGGILTESDRSVLIKNDFIINDHSIAEMYKELSLAYNSVSAASERLYVCWSKNSTSGEKLYPSRIVTDIKRILPDVVCYCEDGYLALTGQEAAEPIVNAEIALEKQALFINSHTEFSDSLLKVLSENEDTKTSVARILDISRGEPEQLAEETASKMFGGNIGLSPTAIETYYRCPFRYFCRYGMNVRVPSVAEIDNKSRGTLVHYCLEHIVGDFGSEALKNMTEKEIYDRVVVLLENYLENVMGGRKNKSNRFLHNYKMTVQLIKQLALLIAEEFKQGRFVASHCELEIGESMSSHIRPVKIKNPDGTYISVRGFIDRVDVCKDGEKTYIRVIDYKTGLKQLTPTRINNGLDLQMPLYLFTLCQNGEELFGKERIPAAVLYMHAADKIVSTERNASAEEIQKELNKKSKMSGLFLNDEGFIDALDSENKGRYVDLSYTKSGALYKKTSIVTMDVMQSIEQKIHSLLLDMVAELRKGKIAANPVDVDKKGDGCMYCDYYSVCRLDKNSPHRQAEKAASFDFRTKEE